MGERQYKFPRGTTIFEVRPELRQEWDYIKNGGCDPNEVLYGAAKKYWWRCPTCCYSYEAAPNRRTSFKRAVKGGIVYGASCPNGCEGKIRVDKREDVQSMREILQRTTNSLMVMNPPVKAQILRLLISGCSGLAEHIKERMKNTSEYTQYVVSRRLTLDGEACTPYEDIAEHLHMTIQRVRQIEIYFYKKLSRDKEIKELLHSSSLLAVDLTDHYRPFMTTEELENYALGMTEAFEFAREYVRRDLHQDVRMRKRSY